MQVLTPSKTWDVCVVGSGAGGGMAAKVLAEAGAEVVILEAGQPWDSGKDGAMFAWNYDSPRRGKGHRGRPFGELDACVGGWDIEGEPYTVAPGSQFRWFRGRMLGGRTNHWGRISLRFGPWDFKARSRDGLGDDWPIGYEDIRPYYDRLDRMVGIFGSNEGIENEPDGLFMPPPKPRCYELAIQKACKGLGIPVIPSRLSILTQPLGDRPACHYCSQCGRGCSTHSNFSTPSVLLPPALATGKLKILTGAMAREVTTDAEGLATGVAYVDTATGEDRHVRARIVVVAASACESARLLLNSRSSRHPNGLANSSGGVGRYLTDSVGTSVGGFIPALADLPPHNDDGVGGMHVYIPWWLDNRTLDFPRGYHVELGGGRHMPGYGFGGGIEQVQGGGYGKALKDDYRRYLRRLRGLRRPRRDDPEREELLRDRPRGRGPVGDPGPAFPLGVVRERAGPGPAHAPDIRRDHRGDGREGDRAEPEPAVARGGAERGRDLDRRGDHPRGGDDPDGNEPPDVGPQRVVPGARREERLRGRRRALRDERPQELHLDDPRPRDEDGRAHRRRAEEGEPVSDRERGRAVDGRGAATEAIARREALRRVGAVPLAAGLALSPARLQAAQEHVHKSAAKAAAKGKPDRPKFFTAHEWATVRVLADP